MKTFNTPIVELVKFAVSDVITASGETEVSTMPAFSGQFCAS